MEPTVPPQLTSTRLAWQSMGEHVLSAARHAATGRIGLRATSGGIGTPTFEGPAFQGAGQLLLVGDELVIDDAAGRRGEPVTTLRAGAAFAGISAGAPTDVYTPSTPLDLDAPLTVDLDAASYLASFYAVVDDALEALRREASDADPGEVQLWPEHFDLATTIDEVNYGGSPGDDAHPEPYLYVGPWTTREGAFWNEPFGASLAYADVATVDDALVFFREGRDAAAG